MSRHRAGRAAAPRGWFSASALLCSACMLVLLSQVVVYLAHAATILPYPFDVDQGEGYDVNSGWLLLQGRPIYTDNEIYPYYSSNYPPLYSLAVAGAILAWGPTALAGRAVSLLATGGLAILIFFAARRRSSVVGGLAAVGIFFLSSYVFHVTALARVNALAGLLALSGLLCIERYRRPTYRSAGLVLILLAIFTKPTAIDAAVAGLGFMALTDRGLAVRSALALAIGGGAVALALEIQSGRAFSLNVLLGNVNPFLPEQLRAYLLNFLLLHAAPLGLATFATIRGLRSGELDVLHLFLASGALMALGVGKWGAGESYFLSAIIAMSVLAGAQLGALASRGGVGVALASVLLVGQSLVSAHGVVSEHVAMLPDRGMQARELGRPPTSRDLELGHGIETRLRAEAGPGLVEDPGFELAAGKEIVGNATHLRNLHEAGLWRGEALVADLAARRYHTVVLHAELYPPPVLAAIGRHYFLYDEVEVYGARHRVFYPGAR